MRRALIVGINDYEWAPLNGCINDANYIYRLLDRHGDEYESPNFDCRKITSDERKITRNFLKKQIHQLFSNQADLAILYFSGHGAASDFGGYLVTQDALDFDAGVSMNDIMIMANQSKAREVIIMLDCCHSGHIGNDPLTVENVSLLREGVSIITSSADYQISKERKGLGVFTKMICEALEGEAADLLGKVNIAGIYGYADKSLNSWEQRPVFKSHVSTMTSIRNCKPRIKVKTLKKLPEYFEAEDSTYPLTPEYEFSHKKGVSEKIKIFRQLQKFNSAGLVVPVGEDHMYFAAIRSKSCKLSKMGQYYWKLAQQNLI